MLEFLKYNFWPAAKTRLIYWWWIIKYGGKKNIPPELIFGAIGASMRRMRENLMQALRAMPPDMSEEDKKEFLEIMGRTEDLEDEFKKLK